MGRSGIAAMGFCLALAACGPPPRAPNASLPPGRVPDWNPAPPPPAKNGLAVVVEGGVSLGAYQAGYLYALSEELKREHVRPQLYAGASAGTINALLLGVEMCHDPTPEPSQSVLRRAWMLASLARLRHGTTTTSPSAVFPQDGVRQIADLLRERLTQPMIPGCNFVVVAETSRLRPRQVPLQGNDSIPDMAEPFAIQIAVDAKGRPEIHNYVADDGEAHALLPFPRDQSGDAALLQAIDLLEDLALASSAFPGAFPQVPLHHCMTVPNDPCPRQHGDTDCGDLPLRVKAPFLDGGILDNTPLGLAIATAQSGWKGNGDGSGTWGAPVAVKPGQPLPASLAYLFVDTDNDAYDAIPARSEPNRSVLAFAGQFAGGFLGAARNRALYDTLQRYPDLTARLVVSQVHPRLASAFLVDFFGFFDDRLRDFDFTAGMYDADQLFESGGLASLLADDPKLRLPPPHGGRRGAAMAGSSLSWRKLACMVQAYGDPPCGGIYDRCQPLSGDAAVSPSPPWQPIGVDSIDPDFESFVELLQASLDELYAQCSCARALSERPVGAACAELLANETQAPRLRPSFALGPDWQRTCAEDVAGDPAAANIEPALDYAIRRLAQYRFASSSVQATNRMIRERLGALADDLASRQPFWQDVVASVGGPVILDGVYGYVPPRESLHLVSGLGTEVGWSHGGWARLAVALQAKGAWGGPLAWTPLVGAEGTIPHLPMFVQLHPFARIGFQLGHTGPNDVVAGSMCWFGRFEGHAGECIVGQAGLAADVVELLRVQALWQQSADSPPRALDHLIVQIGVQANWPMANP